MRKIEKKAQTMAQLGVFACPVCGEPLAVDLLSLACRNGHRYDLAKKGTVNFLTKPSVTEYDTPMLEARRRVLEAGFFAPFIEEIQRGLKGSDTVLDVGCGEGTPTASLAASGAQTVGFDISAPAIALAGRLETDAVFCVADLARLPFLPASFSALVDLFSPGAYQEFDRVLKPGGRLFKVIPAAGYLRELRQGLYEGTAKAEYSNEAVRQRFLAAYSDASETPITYDFPVSASQFDDIMKMTPLTWQAAPSKRAAMLQQPPASIHVDVVLLEADR